MDLLAVQGIFKSLLQHHSSKGSILQCSALFIVQLSAGRRKRSASKLHPGQEGVFCGGTAVIITANICHTFLRGQHCSIYLTCTCSYDCPCSSVRDGCCYDPFYRWRYRGTGRLSSLPEVTQPARSLGSRLCRLGAPPCSLTLCLSILSFCLFILFMGFSR